MPVSSDDETTDNITNVDKVTRALESNQSARKATSMGEINAFGK